jgi:hypothetical protein
MSNNDELNKTIKNYVPPTPSPKICPGCDGKGWQVGNDGMRHTCPMCGGTGTFMPVGTIVFKVMPPQPVYIVPNPCDERPKPDFGWKYIPSPTFDPDPWRRRDHYTGDDPRDWHGPPKVIC